jgi:hypothetical protein
MSTWPVGIGAGDAVLIVAVMTQSVILGANLFEYVVNVPNWREPGGVVAYRTLMRRRHPGHFFQTIVPVSIALLVAALVLGWVDGGEVALVGVALATVVASEVFTLLYFMPRNRSLFIAPVETEPGALSVRLVNEWAGAALIRIATIAIGVVASLLALSLH